MAIDKISFAKQVREFYPEGLTAVYSFGSTRTYYLLNERAKNQDPGKIADFQHFSLSMMDNIMRLLSSFYELGGSNLIMLPLTVVNFLRNEKYVEPAINHVRLFISDKLVNYYKTNKIDPYFILDSWNQPNVNPNLREVAEELIDFQKQWPYDPKNRKFIQEYCLIPVESVLSAHDEEILTTSSFEFDLNQYSNYYHKHVFLYKNYIRKIYGIEVPLPHFYLGSATRGMFKLHLPFPSAITAGIDLRLFFVPYPMLYMTDKTLATIIDDLMHPKSKSTLKEDYSKLHTAETLEIEFQRIQALASDEHSTLGLSHHFGGEG